MSDVRRCCEEKKQLRRQMKKKRDELTAEERMQASMRICEKLVQLELFQSAQTIYFYAPVGSEVDLWPLWERAHRLGKRTFFPKVFGDTMRFFQVTDKTQLAEGSFHVLEPDEDWCMEADDKSALVLTPGLLFDRACNRCGYGKGYYDRFLSAHSGLYNIGIEYCSCTVSSLVRGKFDIAADLIVTEKYIKKIKA